MADIVFELVGVHFRRQYLLYIIELSHKGENYYYIGQTGDHRYTTARPAFRRLAAHFEDREKSTQNQVYKYIASNLQGHNFIDDNAKQAVEEFLVNSRTKMYSYSLEPFVRTNSHDAHLKKVHNVTNFEKLVINLFITNGKKLMNKKVPSIEFNSVCYYPNALKQIVADFGLDGGKRRP